MGEQPESENIKILKKRLEAKTEQCRKYEEKLAEVSVIKRWKLGEYLHDNLAQKLNYAKILTNFLKENLPESQTDLIEQCDEILSLIDEGARDARDLSHDIIPIEIEKEGVAEAFTHLKDQAEKRHGVSCVVETGEVAKKVDRREITSNLYLIAQEAIKNAIVHGEATNVKIALFEHDGQLYLHVKDDGKGFDPSEKGGIGLDLMKYRAEETGGTFRIRDAKENEEYATYVTCTLPLKSLTDS